jgi:hypothetical protein
MKHIRYKNNFFLFENLIDNDIRKYFNHCLTVISFSFWKSFRVFKNLIQPFIQGRNKIVA